MMVGAVVTATVILGVVWCDCRSTAFADLPPGHMVSVAAVFPKEGTLAGARGAAVADGELLLAGSSRQVVYRLEGDGTLAQTLSVTPGERVSLSEPVDVARHGDCCVVIDTAGDGRVVLLPDRGAPTTLSPGDRAFKPTAVACADDEILVADAATRRVLVFSRSGTLRRELGAELSPPLGIAGGLMVDGDEVWVSDTSAGRVIALDLSTGRLTGLLEKAMNLPRGITRDTWGRMYVADEFAQAIHVFDDEGRALGTIESRRDGVASPRDVEWLDGRLWVVDSGNDRIVVYNVRRP